MEKIVTQIKIILLIFGDAFNQEDLSKLIGINPSNIWNKGDEIAIGYQYKKSKNLLKRKETAWEYTEGFIQTLDFDVLTDRLLELFGNKEYILKDFIEKYDLNLTVNVVVEIANGQTPGLSLSKSFISFLNKLNAEIDFDLYVYDDE